MGSGQARSPSRPGGTAITVTDGPGHFDQRRQELNAIGAQLWDLAQLVCRDRPECDARLVRARAMLEESAVTLCVAGGEGAGKSTLVDAILGSEVVPTEEAEPGTVAPVLVHWHDADTPAYSVLLQGGEAPVPCVDVAQFRRFTLQSLNPANRSGLVCGIVGLRHPLLADGLRLVDMPGAEGSAEGIKEDTLAALREAHAILFVIRDRIFATVKRLVADLTAQGVAIQGVVSNQDAQLWRKNPELATQVKDVLRRQLAESGAQISIERIFVLHLPSILRLELAPDATIADEVHTAEIARFREWLTHYLDAPRVTAILSEVATEFAAVERTLWQALRSHLDKLTAIENGANTGSLLSGLKAARHAFSARWSGVLQAPELDEVVVRHRSIIATLLRKQGEHLRATVASVRRYIGGRDHWTAATVTRIVGNLRPVFDSALRTIATANEDAMKVVIERLRAIADPMTLELIVKVPLVLGRLPAVNVEGSTLFSLKHPDPGVADFFEIFSDARRVDRILNGYEFIAGLFSAAVSAEPMLHFAANVQRAAAVFAAAFEARIAELEALVMTPDPDRIAEARQIFNEMGQHLGKLGSRLHEVDPSFAKQRA